MNQHIMRLTYHVIFNRVVRYRNIISPLPRARNTRRPFMASKDHQFSIRLFKGRFLLRVLAHRVSTSKERVLISTLVIQRVLRNNPTISTMTHPLMVYQRTNHQGHPFMRAMVIMISFTQFVHSQVTSNMKVTTLS